MNDNPLSVAHLEAVVFDVVGTLVDEDAAWARAAARIATTVGLDSAEAFHRRWAGILDERMDAVVAGRAAWLPHRRLVSDAADDAIRSSGAEPSPETTQLVSGLDREYRAWPDVPGATALLRRELLVAGLSNADLDSLARLSNRTGISWDAALSTGTVGTFKPAPEAYRHAIDTLAIDPRRTLFVAAHPWDLRAAARHGFRTAYVARPPRIDPPKTIVSTSSSPSCRSWRGSSAGDHRAPCDPGPRVISLAATGESRRGVSR